MRPWREPAGIAGMVVWEPRFAATVTLLSWLSSDHSYPVIIKQVCAAKSKGKSRMRQGYGGSQAMPVSSLQAAWKGDPYRCCDPRHTCLDHATPRCSLYSLTHHFQSGAVH